MPSPERLTADKLVAAYNVMDVSTIIALRTPDCARVFLPASLNFAPQSTSAFQQNLLAMHEIFTSFSVVVDEVIEGVSSTSASEDADADAAPRKKIVMYVTARGQSAVGEYRNQYVWNMGFTPDGMRIAEWSEFVDVGVARDFFPLLKAEIVRRAGEGKKGNTGEDKEGQSRRQYVGLQGGEGGVR